MNWIRTTQPSVLSVTVCSAELPPGGDPTLTQRASAAKEKQRPSAWVPLNFVS
jgi:hypothetical protein